MDKRTKNDLKFVFTLYLVTMVIAFACSGCSMQSQIDELNKGVDGINRQIGDLRARIGALEASVPTLQSQINTEDAKLVALQNSANSNAADITDAQAMLIILQAQYNATLSELATLSSNVQVQAVVDPCGDGPGYDEVLLKTSVGYLAYFEDGGHRHLTLLQNNVQYRTTDAQSCYFKIINGTLTY